MNANPISIYEHLERKLKLKYAIDRLLALCFLVFMSPLMAAAIFLIKLDGWIRPENSGSVFYDEPRVSRGEVFNIIKFRTVPEDIVKWVKDDPENRSITGQNEKTWSGRMILKWYFDELPQLINILKGEMSFVGPRPHVIAQSHKEMGSGFFEHRKYIKCGLVGIMQAMKRDKTYRKIFDDIRKKGFSGEEAAGYLEGLYALECANKNPIAIILYDLSIMARSLITVIKGA